MKKIEKIGMFIRKLFITLRDLKKTAYHHYGESPMSIIKFIYYSVLRVNTFFVYENDLTRELPEHNLEPEFKVMKPTLDELAKVRQGLDLPREFYYDEIFHTKTCYLVFKGDELAKICWVLFKEDYNRFLILRNDVAELNYNTTLPKYRGNQLMSKMMAYISLDLKKEGYKKAMGVIHEFNPPAIKAIEKAGFIKVGEIKTLGPFNRKLKF